MPIPQPRATLSPVLYPLLPVLLGVLEVIVWVRVGTIIVWNVTGSITEVDVVVVHCVEVGTVIVIVEPGIVIEVNSTLI
jgi:hypothetical protein